MTTPVNTMPEHPHDGRPCTHLQILQRDMTAIQRQREEDKEAIAKQRSEDQERHEKEREHFRENIALLFQKLDKLQFWLMVTGVGACGALLVILLQIIIGLATAKPPTP
jgi:hypothetical protein